MGHGLNYVNVRPVCRIPGLEELNIGHSIVARAVMVGMTQAVSDMKRVITEATPETGSRMGAP
jgi:pyridoxine 5-phosphate synthase